MNPQSVIVTFQFDDPEREVFEPNAPIS
jgi:hypothetical protein